jgi:hypothetical protein
MKSGKYKYFAGGLIGGMSGQMLKMVLKTPQVKSQIAKRLSKMKEYYKGSKKYEPKFEKAIKNLDTKRVKVGAVSDALTGFNKRVKNAASALFVKGHMKNAPERKAVAISMKTLKRLKEFESELSKKGKALIEKKLNKIKTN